MVEVPHKSKIKQQLKDTDCPALLQTIYFNMRSPIFISVDDYIDGYETFSSLLQLLYSGTIVSPVTLYNLELVANLAESLGLPVTAKKVGQIV